MSIESHPPINPIESRAPVNPNETLVPLREAKINEALAERKLENSQEKKEKPYHYDAAIVFGFGVLPEEKQKNPDEKKWRLSFASRLRLDAAALLYLTNKVREIFVSEGYQGSATMKNYLVNYWGIPETDVKEEAHSTNTLENLAGTINILDEKREESEKQGTKYEYQNIALISNGFHVSRIKELARLYNFESTTVSAEEEIRAALDERPELEKKIISIKFEPDETQKKAWAPAEHDPKRSGFNVEEMKNRFHNPNGPEYQSWLQGEDLRILPLVKHGWEINFLQDIAQINAPRLQRMIAKNENIQKFIDSFVTANLDNPETLKTLNINKEKNEDLKVCQKKLQELFRQKNINPENKEFGKQIARLNEEFMEEFRKILQTLNRYSSTLFQTPRDEVEAHLNE